MIPVFQGRRPGGVWRGLRWGRDERSRNPALPSARKRASHLRTLRLHDYEGAIADYNVALRIDPKDPTAYANRGTIRHVAGDLEGAIADYDRANQLNQTKRQHAWTEEIMAKL
jgi:tetratricopeptide (TPR) repeat protein